MKNLFVSDEIELCPVSLKDVDDIFFTIDRERKHLGRWLPFVEYTTARDDSLAFVKAVMVVENGPGDIIYAIRYQGLFAGLIGYKFTDRANRKTEIGYWISERYQGKGIITRSVRAMIDQAFDQWGFHRIQINVAVGNKRSKRIPRRLGFSLEGIARDAELLSIGFTDIEMYALLRPDWIDKQ
ncbi:MAG: GNAT family protein [Bacteroidales bacterium]|jgi:ribosomal-protein-serine acetyltransferase|nr:GNAT family protein [Bacteroidales bacterium]NLM93033.1 GNAT family N-acetyltransferase [Bacteroidales bacterium]